MTGEKQTIRLVVNQVVPSRPWVVYSILGTCILVWVAWNYFGEPRHIDHPMIPWGLTSIAHLKAGEYLSLLTAAFSHYLPIHLLVNMVVLLSFGPTLERELGSVRFLIFYLVAAVISSLIGILLPAWIGVEDHPMLGASGALSGVLALFVWRHPKVKLLLFFVIPLPAIFALLALVVFDVGGLIAQHQGGGLPIAHGGHLGGVLVGLTAAALGLGRFESQAKFEPIERLVDVYPPEAVRFEQLQSRLQAGEAVENISPEDVAFLEQLAQRSHPKTGK